MNKEIFDIGTLELFAFFFLQTTSSIFEQWRLRAKDSIVTCLLAFKWFTIEFRLMDSNFFLFRNISHPGDFTEIKSWLTYLLDQHRRIVLRSSHIVNLKKLCSHSLLYNFRHTSVPLYWTHICSSHWTKYNWPSQHSHTGVYSCSRPDPLYFDIPLSSRSTHWHIS